MRYMLAFILIVFATFMSFAVNAQQYYSPGSMVGIRIVCKTEDAMLYVANADTKSLEAVKFAIEFQAKRGHCVVLPQRVTAALKEKIHTYEDYDGAATEVWSLFGASGRSLYTIVVVPGLKKSSA